MFRHWPLFAFAVAAFVSGCSKAPAPVANQPAAVTAPADDHAMPHAEAPALSAEDQALADKQKVCPVGGKLGSMGHPVKVMIGNRAVFLCCVGCKEEVEANPEKYLAKLDAAAAAPAEAAPEGGTPAAEVPAGEAPVPATEEPVKPE